MGQESSVMLKGDLTLSWPMRGFLGMGGCAAAGISCTPVPFRNLRLPFILPLPPPPVAIVILLLLIYLCVCVCVFILSMSCLLIPIYSTPFRRVPSA